MKKLNRHKQLSEHINAPIKEVWEDTMSNKSLNKNLEHLYKTKLISPNPPQTEYFNFFAGGKALNSPVQSFRQSKISLPNTPSNHIVGTLSLKNQIDTEKKATKSKIMLNLY